MKLLPPAQASLARSSWSPFLLSCGTLVVCWALLLAWVCSRAEKRIKLDFPGSPNGVRSVSYASWLLSRSRKAEPGKKILFLGDSIVHGLTSSNRLENVAASFGEIARRSGFQTFSFALDGIGPADHLQILKENALSEDYVIAQLAYSQNIPQRLDLDHRKIPASSWGNIDVTRQQRAPN